VTHLGGDEESPEIRLFISGALGKAACDGARSQLLALAAACKRMTVDLSEVTILGAPGFALLLELHKRLSRAGARSS
jgi:ABC-type transporter Mla MlaB component